MSESAPENLFQLTIQIVSAYVSKHQTDLDDLSEVIWQVSYGLNHAEKKHLSKRLNPPVPISETVTDDYIICLEDGKKLKMLKRHLNTVYKIIVWTGGSARLRTLGEF